MIRLYVTSVGPHSKAADSPDVTARFPIISADLPTFIHWVAVGNSQSPFFTTPEWDTLEEFDYPDPELESIC